MAITCTVGYTWSASERITASKLNQAPTVPGITLAASSSITTAGAFGLTLTTTALTNVTLPTTGTLATLAGAETLTNKILTAPDINAGTADSLTSLSIRSTGAAFDLTLATSTVFTAGRTLTILPGDSARTITLSGNPTLADWFDQSVKSGASPTFAATNFTGASGITGTGALNSGSITSGFGSIDVGADSITGGAITGTGVAVTGAVTASTYALIGTTTQFSSNYNLQLDQTVAGGLLIRSQAASTNAQIRLETFNSSGTTSGSVINLSSYQGTIASPTATLSGDAIYQIQGKGYGNAVNQIGSYFRNIATALWSATSYPSKFEWGVAAVGSTTPSTIMSMDSAGLAVTGAVSTTDPAGGAGPAWKLGVAASVSPTSPNRTIRIDIAGTSYYLHAKTTND